MFHRLIPVAALIAVIGFAVSAQPPAKESKQETQPAPTTKSDPKTEPNTFELRMQDDTVMKVVLVDTSVSVITKYGKLAVPASEVRRLEFGFRYPEGVEAKIDAAIGELGSAEFRTREDAEQRLAEIGFYSIPALRRAQKHTDPEVVRRAGAVLKVIEGKLGDHKGDFRDYDVVETAEFTVKGKLELTGLKVRTKYFGDTTVKLTDIKTFRSVGSSSNAEFALDASKYAKMNQADWMETQVEVSSGQQLEVSASGKIDQWPQGPGQYMSEPSGLPGHAPGQFLPQGGARIGIPGQIVGKIGPNGTPFAIGASYKGKMTDSGKLYLRISPSPWNCESTGNYKVTANVTSP
jgi:hypothetical protein